MSGEPWIRREVVGDAVLYLGDSTKIWPAVAAEVESVVSDPPFGMNWVSNQAKHESRAGKISIANDDSDRLLQWAARLEAPFGKYLFCRWDNVRELPKPKSMITWVKNVWTQGDLEHEHGRQTEVACFYPGPQHAWPNARPSDVVHEAKTANENHPTEKPVPLMVKVVGWTRGVVCDPFMGSGTTGVACAQLGRPFIGMELDEEHFETALRRIREAQARWSGVGGGWAKAEQTGLFADLPKARPAAKGARR